MKKFMLVCLVLIVGVSLFSQNIHVQNPNGGENWIAGSNRTISWVSSGITNGKFTVHLFDGPNSIGVIKGGIPCTNGPHSISWTVGRLSNGKMVPHGTNYRIKVRQASAAPKDFSDFPFTISGQKPKTTPGFQIPLVKMHMIAANFGISSPKKDDIWYLGNSYLIQWEKLVPMGLNVRLSIYREGQSHIADARQDITITPSTPNNGSYLWDLSGPWRTGKFILRLETLDQKTRGDSSPFSLANLNPGKVNRAKAPPLLPPKNASFTIKEIKHQYLSNGKLGKIAVKIQYKSDTHFSFTNYKGHSVFGTVYLDCKIFDAKYPMNKTYTWKAAENGKVYSNLQYQQIFAIKTTGQNHLDYSPKILSAGTGEFELFFTPPSSETFVGLHTYVKKEVGFAQPGAFCNKYYFPKMKLEIFFAADGIAKIYDKQIYLTYDYNKLKTFGLRLPGKVDNCNDEVVKW